jgi:uncharacterized protein (TIGR02996 family)
MIAKCAERRLFLGHQASRIIELPLSSLSRCPVILAQAFLADIIEHSDDDAPRLVFADWLSDQGDEDRAEFIRVQCRRARLPYNHPEQLSLGARQAEHLGRHEDVWRAELPRLEDVAWQDFTRGFVETVFVGSVDAFLGNAPALFAAAPIRCLRIGSIDPPGACALALSPYLARLTELNLCNGSGLCGQGVAALARSPHLGHLAALLLHYNPLEDDTIADLASSTRLGGLRELYLSGTGAGDAAAVGLACGRNMPHLTDLDLRDNRVSGAGASALAFNVGLEELATLYLVNNQIGPSGAEALAWTERLPGLRRLYLNHNPIGNAGAVALATSPHLGRLAELDLRHCDITDAGGRALADSAGPDGLQALWLGGNRLRTETLTLLRRRFRQRLHL